MPLSRFLPRRYSTRLMAMALISGLIPIIIFALLMKLFADRFPIETDLAIQQGQEEQWQRSRAVLRQMAQDYIRTKALDVALQLELYLHAHPEMTVQDLQNDPGFREIAVQPVGKTGYTTVQDSETGINRFHKNPGIENLDLHSLADRLPEFRAIMKASLGGKYSHGYYRWKEADGEMRDKVMYIAPLAEKTADGVRFGVAATTYIDEFTRSIEAAQDVSRSTTRYLMITLNRLIQSFTRMGLLFMGLGIVLVSALSLWVGIYFSRAITGLRRATRAVNQGNFDARVSPAMSGDVGELIEDFNRMVGYLATTTVKKEQLEISEEKLRAINAELLQSEEKYRTILETIEDGYYEVDLAGNHTFFNDALLRILGFSRDEFTGMNYRCYTAPENVEKVYQAFNQVYRTGKPGKGFDWEITTRNGTKTHWEVSISLIRDSEGQPIGFRGIVRDITEKKRAEESLRESGKKYKILTESSLTGIFIHQDGKYVFVNDRFAQIHGYKSEELLVKDYLTLIHPDERGAVKQRASKRLKGKAVPQRYEIKRLRKDGKTIWCEIMVTLIQYSGRPAIMGNIIDITEREQAKADLLYLKEYNEKIVASIPSSLLVLDRNLNIKSVNRTYLETGGIKDEDVVGKNIKEVFPHHILKEGGLLHALEEVMATRETRSLYEVKHTSSDHPEKILNITVSGLRRAEEEEEEEEELILVIEDITERARMREEIRKSRDFMDTIFKTSVDMVVTTDERGIMTFVNRAMERIAGYKEEELVGRHVSELYDRGRERGKDMMDILTSGQALKNYRLGLLAKQGREIPVSISGSLLKDSQGRVIGTFGFLRDVSRLVEAEEEIRKKNEELENFVYVVSHDLKSPIVSMQGFSSMLLNEYREKLGDEGGRYIERIRANASRMEVLISDLLALSRVGRVVGAFKDVSSLDIVNRVCNGLESRMEENRIEVFIGDNLPTIRCDGDRIYQVFENLIINAVKFTGDVEKPRIEIGYEEREGFHRFYVRDNGIGIDKKYHRKIFEIFQRLKEIEDEKGTGIGLVIVERIVKNHGGKVWVESQKGEGATFCFTLPRQSGHAE
ncbi:MAG: PAS domain S-box protein [Pseudomonadota bacterium]